jgi:hypothetical protein
MLSSCFAYTFLAESRRIFSSIDDRHLVGTIDICLCPIYRVMGTRATAAEKHHPHVVWEAKHIGRREEDILRTASLTSGVRQVFGQATQLLGISVAWPRRPARFDCSPDHTAVSRPISSTIRFATSTAKPSSLMSLSSLITSTCDPSRPLSIAPKIARSASAS